ncbi:TRIC cation channel family protein [Pseudonocardia kujensis]|uniref:trimeric intracellular cation channel family protein n=1 Tax=Pseudonocardia kujensis TaxID=1128675 RepID=UPI001E370104|nr:TRIC cation channel family protein [Pseudonocardia kujensis]MCE0766106.1 TRIC cation channel family protein [Pseudonocardia kujensis]
MTAYGVAGHVLELGGVFAIAALGADLCRRRELNGLAVTLFAMVSALGGGLVRDLVIGAPPVAFHSVGDPAVALAAGLTVVVLGRHLPRVLVPLQLVEAVGLGVLCVNGTARALAAGQAPVAAAALGVVTVVGGGIVRDSLTGRVPGVFRRGRETRPLLLVLTAVTAVVLLRLGRLDPAVGLVVAACAATMLLMCERVAAGAPPGAEPVSTSVAVGPLPGRTLVGAPARPCRSTAEACNNDRVRVPSGRGDPPTR